MRLNLNYFTYALKRMIAVKTAKSILFFLTVSIALSIFLLYLEVLTGHEIVLLPLFLFPIAVATVFVSPICGYLFCFGASLASNLSEAYFHPSHFTCYFLLNAFLKFFVVIILVKLLSLLADAYAKERRAAISDSLTGLANRRHFYGRLKVTLEDAKRYSHSLSVAYFDLDKFKAVNDTYGHAKGDEVLMAVSSILSSSIRSGDLAARLGGDEFAIILPFADAGQAKAATMKLNDLVTMKMKDLGLPVRISIGIVSSCEKAKSIENIMTFVDKLMYDAKKNNSVIKMDSMPEPIECPAEPETSISRSIAIPSHNDLQT